MRTLPDGRHVLTGDDSGGLTVWELSSGRRIRTLAGHSPHAVNAIHVAADGRYVITTGVDRTVRLWNLANGECVRTRRCRGSMADLTLAPDSRVMTMLNRLTDQQGYRIRIWRLDGRRRARVIRTARKVTADPFALDQRIILIAEKGGDVGVWDAATGCGP
jgi:hypothetical protein